MGVGVEMSGGSAANTLAGIASFGGRGGFIGRVRDDELGKVFAHDIRAVRRRVRRRFGERRIADRALPHRRHARW
jgi:sugar/nucleoside kinase (ribokinase family)